MMMSVSIPRSVTDAAAVWSSDCSEDSLKQLVSSHLASLSVNQQLLLSNTSVPPGTQAGPDVHRGLHPQVQVRGYTQLRSAVDKATVKTDCLQHSCIQCMNVLLTAVGPVSSRAFSLFLVSCRASCLSGDVSVVVENTSAALRVSSGLTELNLTLTMMEAPQAMQELKELLFTMADRLTQLGGGSPDVSPLKNLQRCPPDFKPRQQQPNDASSGTVKRRLPGASLINPGTKKKMQATGVAFEDED
ncbi:hypothetical protein XENOCAPTIV_005613 [Xenoophorus captivus]|uniref:Uncharacterized protein n=1 Tax=Xenoophorus captivus TaxID=1517983 RepID=A0ABV0Q881_9TELE